MQELKMVKVGCVSEKAVRFTSPALVYDACRDMANLDREHFVVLHLDGKNRIAARETVSIGSLNQTIVHPREVFKTAVHNGSAAIICVHNHPTGDPMPSQEDIYITRRLCSAGELIGIKVLDHIIIGQDNYLSFVETGYMNNQQTNMAGPPATQKEPSRAELFKTARGRILKELRKNARITQAKLFEATGIHQSTLSSIERGRHDLSEKEAQKLAGVFAVDYRMFLFAQPETNQKAQAA